MSVHLRSRTTRVASVLRVALCSSCRVCALGALLAALLTGSARADGAITANGTPISTSDYAVDFSRGPVLSSSRATGLAGAITAIAEGAEGGLSNPAAVANRYAGSVDWWDYWLAFGITYPIENGDFFNSGSYLKNDGEVPETGFTYFNPGLYVQLGRFAFGLDMDIQNARTTVPGATKDDEDQELRLRMIISHVQLGWLFLDGQLSVGGGLTVMTQNVRLGGAGKFSDIVLDPGSLNGESVLGYSGYGAELGVLLRPNGRPWRLGASVFSRVRASSGDGEGDRVIEGYYVPDYAERPWQGNLAFAYQVGGRPLNPRFSYVEEFAHHELREIEQRVQAAHKFHEARVAELRAHGGPDTAAAIERARVEYAEQQALFELERAAVRKAAWRELRVRVRTGWPRRYALLTGELSFTGRVDQAVGIESFLLQTVQRSGEKITVTPRFAVESEVWPTWMRLRAGMYIEPTRFEQSLARLHGTFGLDLRVLHWDVFRVWPEDYLWQLTFAGDISTGYAALSFGFGGWY